MAEPKELTPGQNKKLKSLNLSPKVEERVRAVWQEEAFSINNEEGLLNRLIILLIVLCFFGLQILTIYEKSRFGGLDNIVVTIYWLVIIIKLFKHLSHLYLLDRGKPTRLFEQAAIELWSGTDVLNAVYNILQVFMFCALAYSGHIFTAIIFVLCFATGFVIRKIVRQRVQDLMATIEKLPS